jgi:DNA invertase Pin-like site-specific DNA recombinase
VTRLAREARGYSLPPGIGESNPMAKMKEEQVRQILRAHSSGETQASIARRMGIDHRQVGKIVRRERWAHVTEETK